MCIGNTSGPRRQDRLSASTRRDDSAIARLSPSRTGRCTDGDAEPQSGPMTPRPPKPSGGRMRSDVAVAHRTSAMQA
jgi:hypothetical protein